MRGLLVLLPARELDRQALRPIQRIVEPRLELIGDEVAIGPGIDDRHRALVEPRQHHVDDAVGLAHLAPTDKRDCVVVRIIERPDYVACAPQ